MNNINKLSNLLISFGSTEEAANIIIDIVEKINKDKNNNIQK